MLQNAFHIALYNKYDINEKADVLFEEIEQKTIDQPVYFINNSSSNALYF